MAIQSVLEAYGDNLIGSGISLPNSFILRNQTLTFNNLVATVTDSRITTTTLLLTYYSDDSVASAAGVKASVTAAGTITFTATSAPSSTLSVDIVCIVEGLTAQPDGGAGHEIENSAGTKLTQRDVMQVLDGLEAVDDSTNQKTKIKMNLPIVSSADWNAMTEQEKTAYKASHYRFGVEVPDTEGVINAEYMKLLWENPNTTQAFAAQTITLNSADYDFLLILYSYYTGAYKGYSLILKKDAPSAILSCVVFANTAQTNSVTRTINKVTDTSYAFEDAYNQAITTGVTTAVNNSFNIPIAIYGIKKNFQFKVNAIATDLSTRADHCFLSDNEISVEDKFDEITEQIGLKILKKNTSIVPTANSGVSPFSYYASGNFGLPAGATIVAMLVTPYGGSSQRTVVNKMPNQADGFYLYSTSNETVGVSCLYTV